MHYSSSIQVFSEIGKLQEVLLHRPGIEMENFIPEYLQEFLFDDMMYLKVAQAEHDTFSRILREQGVKVRYVEELMVEAMQAAPDAARVWVDRYLIESQLLHPAMRAWIVDWLYDSFDTQAMVLQLIAGIPSRDLPHLASHTLSGMVSRAYPFILKPMPNLLFTRDPFISIGHGVALSSMKNAIRQRETLFNHFIFDHHPRYQQGELPRWFESDSISNLEGGDFLVINATTLFVGISERTDAYSVELLATNLFKHEQNSIKKVVAFVIPKTRAFMHLDTVFTQVDEDKFTIHPGIEEQLTLFTLTPGEHGRSLHIEEDRKGLQELLDTILERSVTLLRCGNGDTIAGAREQWNDGANTLAIAPGEVCVYDRNYITNQLLRDHGVIVHEIPSSELSRGRGGPRCMSMPLQRKIL